LKRRPVGCAQRFQERARRGIVIVNPAIAEIADPKFAVDQCEAPGRIQVSARNDTPEEVATRIEGVHETVPGPSDFIFLLRILEREGDPRYPISPVMAIGVPHMVGSMKISDEIQRTINESTEKNLAHEVQYMLSKGEVAMKKAQFR
jgi:hypothetical protein